MRTRNLRDYQKPTAAKDDKVVAVRISMEDFTYLNENNVAIGRLVRSLIEEQVELLKSAPKEPVE